MDTSTVVSRNLLDIDGSSPLKSMLRLSKCWITLMGGAYGLENLTLTSEQTRQRAISFTFWTECVRFRSHTSDSPGDKDA